MKTTQTLIQEVLEKTPLTVKDLAKELGMSESYIRGQVRLMEETDRVEKTDARQPYIYKIPDDSPMIKHRELMKKIEADLMGKEPASNPFVKIIKPAPKVKWPEAVAALEAIAATIKKLDSEGKLIDTL